jgi:hypothetical protein
MLTTGKQKLNIYGINITKSLLEINNHPDFSFGVVDVLFDQV